MTKFHDKIILCFINNNTIKIGDFGFSREITDNMYNTFCGSPLYMAPEMLKYEPYDTKSDIWSLGITLFELLFKNHPYDIIKYNNNNNQLIKDIISNEEVKVPIYKNDYNVTPFLQKLIIKDKMNRISWKDLFLSEWYIKYNKINDDFELSFQELFTDDRVSDNLSNEVINYNSNYLLENDYTFDNKYNILSDTSSSFIERDNENSLYKSVINFFSL